ncbi:MAG: hypothetical protein ACJ72F_10600 [Nitrososphaeraceae archaeon]
MTKTLSAVDLLLNVSYIGNSTLGSSINNRVCYTYHELFTEFYDDGARGAIAK